MAPTHFFLIDVTHTAVASGATAAACNAIARILDDIQGQLSLLNYLSEGLQTCLQQGVSIASDTKQISGQWLSKDQGRTFVHSCTANKIYAKGGIM